MVENGAESYYYAVCNSRGDVVGLYTGSGALRAEYKYDAWGKVISVTNASGNEITDQNNIALINPIRYRGYCYDSETGYYYLQSRYYDPCTGRFISVDGYATTGMSAYDGNMFAYYGVIKISEDNVMHYVKVKGILSSKNGMNLYRGCSHGCIYCDSRSKCYNIEHAFEDIEVKENAIELLEHSLKHKRKKCMIGTGAMTDPYIPLETELGNVRKALELINKYGFGYTVITKSDRILRDIDLLSQINQRTKCVVQMTLTTYDEDLCRKIEPNVCTTRRRFEVLKQLRNAGIPTVVWLNPILPFINDTEENISGLLDMCIEAEVYGIICFGMGVTLREGNREYFYSRLDKLFPGMKERYIREYGDRYIIDSPNNRSLMRLFRKKCDQNGIVYGNDKIFDYLNKFELKDEYSQLSFWD